MRLLLATLTCALCLLAASDIAVAQPVAGRQYLVLEPARAVAGERIEVIEFFYYGCPVCYESQPHIAQWLAAAGSDVLLQRVPAAGPESGESFALTYYALEAMQELERLHGAIYDNHHFDDQRLNEEASLVEWLRRNGVDAGRFQELRASADTRAKLDAGRRAFETYGIRGVPAFAIDGRYVTSARLAGGVKEMMAVVEHLVARAREERRRK